MLRITSLKTKTTMAANRKVKKKSKLWFCVTVLCLVAFIFVVYLLVKLVQVMALKNRSNSKQQDKSWLEQSVDNLYEFFSVKKEPEKYHIFIYSYLLEEIQEDFRILVVFLSNGFSLISGLIIQMSLLTGIIIFIIVALILYSLHRINKRKRPVKKKTESDSEQTEKRDESSTILHEITRWRTIWITICLAYFISIPWEFCRLYQIEVAKRASVMKAGIPPECVPEQMTMYQSIVYYIQWQLSWQHDPCEKYHKAVLVDPLWEIPPLLVLSSAFTRCIIHPMELFSAGVGKSIKLFFNEIPVVWQPFMLIIMAFILIIFMVMVCGYRISLPFLLKIEPKTPILGRFRSLIASKEDKNCESFEEKRRLDYSASSG